MKEIKISVVGLGTVGSNVIKSIVKSKICSDARTNLLGRVTIYAAGA